MDGEEPLPLLPSQPPLPLLPSEPLLPLLPTEIPKQKPPPAAMGEENRGALDISVDDYPGEVPVFDPESGAEGRDEFSSNTSTRGDVVPVFEPESATVEIDGFPSDARALGDLGLQQSIASRALGDVRLQQSIPCRDPYVWDTVNAMINDGKWTVLESYLLSYMPVSPGEDSTLIHCGLILHFRIGKLLSITSHDEAVVFFQNNIKPLANTHTKFANPVKVKSYVDHIEQLLSANQPVNHLEMNLLMKIRYYMMLYFPAEIGFEHPKNLRSPFWRFMAVDDGESEAKIARCLLCQQVVLLPHKSIKSIVVHHMKTCSETTLRSTELLEEATKADAKSTRVLKNKFRLSTSNCRKKAKGASSTLVVVNHIENLKMYASDAVDNIIKLGRAYQSQESEGKTFAHLVRLVSVILIDIGETAVSALTQSPEPLQNLLREDIMKVTTAAVAKMNELNMSYFSPVKDMTKFDEVFDLIFKIQKSASRTQLHLVPSSREQPHHRDAHVQQPAAAPEAWTGQRVQSTEGPQAFDHEAPQAFDHEAPQAFDHEAPQQNEYEDELYVQSLGVFLDNSDDQVRDPANH